MSWKWHVFGQSPHLAPGLEHIALQLIPMNETKVIIYLRLLKDYALVLGIVTATVTALSGCASTPLFDVERTPSWSTQDGGNTFLGKLVSQVAPADSTLSGFRVLDRGQSALQARLSLSEMAERSIDAQYFIWNDDASGQILATSLIRAAKRGVRIRLLIDDFYLDGRDDRIALMNAHPLIEIRVFNPVRQRATDFGRALGFLANFGQLNHRMHNKLYLVDGSVGIAGGRNVGDEYFGADDEFNMRDRGVLAAGPVVQALAASFDHYWNSQWTVPFEAVTYVQPSATEMKNAMDVAKAFAQSLKGFPYRIEFNKETARTPIADVLRSLVWAQAEVFYDSLGSAGETETPDFTRVARSLQNVLKATREELLIQSPYLILRDAAIEAIRRATAEGVRVSIMTNSMASTDMVSAQAWYGNRRPQILASGARVFELRPDAEMRGDYSRRSEQGVVPLALHAKSIVADRKILYIGTFNLDQRSALINSEIALIIHSEKLANQVAESFFRDVLPANSWEAVLSPHGRVNWIEENESGRVSHDSAPLVSPGRQLEAALMSILPIESQL